MSYLYTNAVPTPILLQCIYLIYHLVALIV